ncbi:hypothetical protein Amal_03864 [Acetobacter malorum]|uniref:Uncharacterized protein n=1 Tax=Acetobacter malorum TaxID=178901 RepID=A0A177G3P0_9PROT|nr:hypothetical protein Amal_03864 [Acetobacter malorum]
MSLTGPDDSARNVFVVFPVKGHHLVTNLNIFYHNSTIRRANHAACQEADKNRPPLIVIYYLEIIFCGTWNIKGDGIFCPIFQIARDHNSAIRNCIRCIIKANTF